MAKRNIGTDVKRAGNSAKSAASSAAAGVASNARKAVKAAPSPSPNPMTNLIIADIALRSGGRLLRHAVERTLLGVRYTPDKAKKIVSGRGMAATLLGTAIARVATRSIPGALLVGGGILAKALYDRSKGSAAARQEGEDKIAERATDT